MSRFVINDLHLPGLKLVQHQLLGDSRGFLTRLFCAEELAVADWHKPIAQINFTYTAKRGTVRGMHFQQGPFTEMKLVSCIRGKVWDVVVDLREGSKTFLQWHAEELSAENKHTLLIPEGFAHGFQSMTDDVNILYCHSTAYRPEAEAGLNPRDPMLMISWPLKITEMSNKDSQNSFINHDFIGIKP